MRIANLRWRHPLLLILAAYALLALWMAAHVPAFEAPDEYFHFAVIEHTARTGTLPPREDAESMPWRQMTYHAPLYYISAAAIIAPLDTGDFSHDYRLNPHAAIGLPDADGNKNFIVQAADPWGGTAWALRLVRAYSALWGAVTVACVYGITRVLAPDSPRIAWIAAALTAFNPQFVFIHTTATNDSLVTALSSAALWAMLRQMRGGITGRGVILLAALAAGASLAKTSGLALYPAVAAGMAWACYRDRVPGHRVILYALIGIAAWALIAGWWYAGNWQTLGSPVTNAQIAAVTGGRDAPLTQGDFVFEVQGILYSLWGVFGWFNITAPPVFYTFTMLILAVGAALALIRAVRERAALKARGGMIATLVIYSAVFIAAWFSFHLQVNAAQGRLFFPLFGVLMPLLAYGLAWMPRALMVALIGGLMLSALLLPPLVIAPEYQGTPPLADADFTPPPDTLAYRFREPWVDAPCVTLWTRPPALNADGDAFTVEFWWRADCVFSGYWSVFVHGVDLTRETCAAGDTSHILMQADTMPQRGALPLPAMTPNRVYHDAITVRLPRGVERPRHVQVGLYDAAGTFMRAFVTASDGGQIGRCAPETIVLEVQ